MCLEVEFVSNETPDDVSIMRIASDGSRKEIGFVFRVGNFSQFNCRLCRGEWLKADQRGALAFAKEHLCIVDRTDGKMGVDFDHHEQG